MACNHCLFASQHVLLQLSPSYDQAYVAACPLATQDRSCNNLSTECPPRGPQGAAAGYYYGCFQLHFTVGTSAHSFGFVHIRSDAGVLCDLS